MRVKGWCQRDLAESPAIVFGGAQAEAYATGSESGVQAVHSDAAQKLGVEVGGFLGHDFLGGGDVHDLVDVAGIQQKGHLGGAAIYGVERGGGFALVGEIFLGGDGL